MKRVLLAASEAVPFMKTGGLADVVGALPTYYDPDRIEARIVLPKYACMDKKWMPSLTFVCHFYVDLGWRRQYAGLFKAEYQGIRYYFIDNEFYFGGAQPYHLIHEDMEKFSYFSKAVLEAIPYMDDFHPDIIHCHDWQTALIPVYLKTVYAEDELRSGIRTVFTIHNLKFQGRWHLRGMQDMTGLPEWLFTPEYLEFYGEGNCIKGGILFSDQVTTVSPSYAREICSPEGGEGMDGLLRKCGENLSGILNGIDTREYNPETDPFLHRNYSLQDSDLFPKKEANKGFLQEKHGFPKNRNLFLVGMVSRMTDQKGFDLISYMMEEMLSSGDYQFVFLGTGEGKYEEMLRYFSDRYPERLAVTIGYSEEEAHEIYGGADAFLMPSLFEPCGLSQLICMRYGCAPVVRETGGLLDTVRPYNEFDGSGTGFSFRNYNAHEMYGTLSYALKIFREHPKDWELLIRHMMREEFSWGASAEKYENLYERL